MTEAQEQEMLFQWAELKLGKYPDLRLMFHIPNGGKRSVAEGMQFKRLGVKRGVPDIFLPVPRWGWPGLFVEMKRSDGGRLSPDQSEFIRELREQGYQAVVCNGVDAAIKVIEDYMEGRL